ncbi:MAG: hypothetical protein IJ733_10140 [Lachnospiraceae bacterium]|nr:hypothetical protein [Lachnospiraceae bacterium]
MSINGLDKVTIKFLFISKEPDCRWKVRIMEKEYNDFCEKLKTELERKFRDETYQVRFHSISKNNSVKYDGIVIYSTESNISPNFSIEPLYENYKDGISIERLVTELSMRYFAEQFRMKRLELDMTYEKCRERIMFRLISYEKNEEELKTMPHIRYLDMAMVFFVLVYQSDEKIGSFQVTNHLMELWGVKKESLMKLAEENARRCFPLKIHNMHQMVMDILSKRELDEEVLQYFQKEIVEDVNEIPVILSNSLGINGAAVLKYEDTLHTVSDMFQGNFYVLPSSIHEVLALPCSDRIGDKELREIVCEVNRDCVTEDEYLSDHVYFYDAEKDALEICL